MKLLESALRDRGNAVIGVLLLLLVVALLLGGNYVRNAKADEQQEKQLRPYAKYKVADLEVLAAGYRIELDMASRGSANRVETRNLHHFRDQVQEFERVQREARKARDKALGVAQLRGDLQAIETELGRRANPADRLKVHLARIFRI